MIYHFFSSLGAIQKQLGKTERVEPFGVPVGLSPMFDGLHWEIWKYKQQIRNKNNTEKW